jgi:hypothetical protein
VKIQRKERREKQRAAEKKIQNAKLTMQNVKVQIKVFFEPWRFLATLAIYLIHAGTAHRLFTAYESSSFISGN